MNDNQKQLRKAEIESRFYPGESAKPAVEVSINGLHFRVQHIVVKRKCYDGFTTPTVQFKLNGKRISRTAAFAALA